MRFRLEVLAQVVEDAPGSWSASVLPLLEVVVDQPTRDEALRALRSALETSAADEVRRIVRGWSTWSDHVMCPEVRLLLPTETWHCKTTERQCPIGASFRVVDDTYLLDGCDAPEVTKMHVVKALRGPYAGEHHLHGRYLCPACNDRTVSKRYRYEFEMQFLSDLIALKDDDDITEARTRLMQAQMSTRPLSTKLCARCMIRVLQTVAPGGEEHFEIVTIAVDLAARAV